MPGDKITRINTIKCTGLTSAQANKALTIKTPVRLDVIQTKTIDETQYPVTTKILETDKGKSTEINHQRNLRASRRHSERHI